MQWSHVIIEGLEDLASYDFQKIAWFENDQNIVSSFNDDVMYLYDPGLDELLQKKTVFDTEADDALLLLYEMIMAIEDDVDEAELIDYSPRMEAIRGQAAKALALVKASDGKDSTVEIMEEPE